MHSKYLHLMMAFAALTINDYSPTYRKTIEALTDDERMEIKRIREYNEQKRKLKRGLKWFKKDGFNVLALNQKSADKKIEAIKKQLNEISIR